jgi:two-component system NtrC family sensor kinase
MKLCCQGNSLVLRIMILVFGALVTLAALLAVINITWIRQFIIANYEACGNRASTIIINAMYHNMLTNSRGETQLIAASTAANDDVIRNIELFNKNGEIMVASDSARLHLVHDIHREPCTACHRETGVTRSTVSFQKDPRTGHHQLTVLTSIANDPSCYTASCHFHPREEKVLGAMLVSLDLGQMDSFIAHMQRTFLLVTLLFTAVIAGVVFFLIHRKIHTPLQHLMEAVQHVGSGNFSYRIPVNSKDEFGRLGEKFNQMSAELEAYDAKLKEWSATLEDKVRRKTQDLRNAQQQMVLMEKMASLGKLSASVAHEINNPLAGVLNYAKLVERTLRRDHLTPDEKERVLAEIKEIQDETRRCGNIVRNLMSFAHPTRGEFAAVSLHSEINKVLALLGHHLEIKNITVHRKLLAEDDTIYADQDQIRQALIALMVNAVEAMDEEGVLTVRTWNEKKTVKTAVRDTGVGITPEDLPHIFEPFFTRKEEGGTGLGLSVVYGIVQRHNGKIEVQSEPGMGSEFIMTIPGVEHE